MVDVLSIVRRRADQLVFEQGLTDSREKAARLIMAGKIAVFPAFPPKKIMDDATLQSVSKPGHAYPVAARFVLVEGDPYVSRGAYKLLTALKHFNIDVTGFTCLDAGASTGGFVDCLLQHGATRVYAVDVGRNQLHEKLRNDVRVISLEGINLRKAAPDLIQEPLDMVTADVSFISLTLVLPICLLWVKPGGRLAALVKPQFELGPGETVKGIIRDENAQQRAVEKIVTFCTVQLGLHCDGVIPASVKGSKGNQEYMAVFTAPRHP